MIRIALIFVVMVTAHAALANDAILMAERQELSSFCQEIEFDDGFLSMENVNGDDLPDFVVNYGSLQCDGSYTAFCGSGGCTFRIYVQGPKDAYELVGDILAHGILFDRPDEASFLVSSHGSACNRVGADACDVRFKLQGDRAVLIGEVGESGDVAPPTDRWIYLEESKTAQIGPDDAQLSLSCENGSVRIHYSADWMMYDRVDMNDHILTWTKEHGEAAYFNAGGVEAKTPVYFIKDKKRLTPFDVFPLDAPLLNGLSRAKWLSIEHGGSLEHTLEYSLKGSGAAIKALRSSCGVE